MTKVNNQKAIQLEMLLENNLLARKSVKLNPIVTLLSEDMRETYNNLEDEIK